MKTRLLATLIVLTLLTLTACAPRGSNTTPTIVPLKSTDKEQSQAQTVETAPTATPTPRPPTPTSTAYPTRTPIPAEPTPTPTVMEAPKVETPSAPQAEVTISALNVRAGPGVNYSIVGAALAGDVLDVIGANASGDWLQVVTADGSPGWISGKPAYTRVIGSLDGVAVIEAPPPPEPAAGPAVPSNGPAGKLVFMTGSSGDLYVINAEGTGLRHLASGGIDPALSPDGQWVAFTRWEDTQHGAFGSLWVINVDGTGERVILNDVRQPKAPVWSPDGTEIAVSMQQGGRLQPEQKCSSSLPSDPVVDREDIRVVFEFEADGEIDAKLCFTLLPHPYWGLRMVDVATSAFEDLPGDRFSYAPAWDPANAWHLVYDGEQGLVNLDLNQGTTWTLTDDVRDHTPVFSPDGSRMAVAYRQHDHWEIHVMNADGSGRVRLTKSPLLQDPPWNNVSPVWSPDSSQIAFLSDRSGEWEIWVMSADGSNQRPLLSSGLLEGISFQFNSVDERMISWGR